MLALAEPAAVMFSTAVTPAATTVGMHAGLMPTTASALMVPLSCAIASRRLLNARTTPRFASK